MSQYLNDLHLNTGGLKILDRMLPGLGIEN